MIDPSKITAYDETIPQLQEKILFWVLAAGKNANQAARALSRFLFDYQTWPQPFEAIRYLSGLEEGWKESKYIGKLTAALHLSGVGCFKSKARAFYELASTQPAIDLRTCGVSDLISIHGIGPKTSRAFILHSRRDARVACLDVHLMRYLAEHGVAGIKSYVTPSSVKSYERIEKEFLRLADASGKSPAQFDLEIWNASRATV